MDARYASLKGRPVFISGGASGIGEGLVRAFAEQGARVAFVDIAAAQGKELAAELGGDVFFAQCDVTDTVGAGDAFFSVAGLAAVARLPLEVATFIGQLAGAQAVNIVGNERPISKAALLKGAMSLLNF